MNITVMIANHNYGNYIKDAISSAIEQTVKPRCICIIDDNSSDNSWDVISSFTDANLIEEQTQPSNYGNVEVKVGRVQDIDIVAIRLPVNVGPSEARNCGIRFTLPVTDVYAILDADDMMLPTKLEECSKPFVNSQIGVVYANYYHVNLENNTKLLEVKEPYDIVRLNQECIVHSGSLIRKVFLEKVKEGDSYYDPTMRTCEDWDLWIRLSKVCLLHHIPIALTGVLVHSNNSTNSVSKEIWQRNWSRIREKHFGG